MACGPFPQSGWCGPLDDARPLKDLVLPECFRILRRRLESDLGHEGTREFIKVLRILERTSVKELTGAVSQAIAIGATGADAVSCILSARAEEPVGLFSLDGHPHLKEVAVESPDLGAYRDLTERSA
jgi:hypothetical protein